MLFLENIGFNLNVDQMVLINGELENKYRLLWFKVLTLSILIHLF